MGFLVGNCMKNIFHFAKYDMNEYFSISDIFSYLYILFVMRFVIFYCVLLFVSRHRGLRHHWGVKVRGQHTKTNGHGNRTVGYQAKK